MVRGWRQELSEGRGTKAKAEKLGLAGLPQPCSTEIVLLFSPDPSLQPLDSTSYETGFAYDAIKVLHTVRCA